MGSYQEKGKTDPPGHHTKSTSKDPVYGPSVLEKPTIKLSSEFDVLQEEQITLEGRVGKNASTAAIILAGGAGERFGSDSGKQLLEIHGKPVLTWSAEAFDATPDVGHIVIVCPEARKDEYCKRALDPFPFVTPITVVDAGDIRQESAMSGVNAVPQGYELIAIHDGARPLITPELIEHALNIVKGTLDADGAVVGHPAIDTLKVVSSEGVVGTPDRSMFWVAQTPQIFRADICRQAFSTAMAEGFVGTDDSSLVERLGAKILLVEGPRDNIKVTVPEDLGPVEAALETRLRKRRHGGHGPLVEQ